MLLFCGGIKCCYFTVFLKNTVTLSGSDTDNFGNHSNWGCRHRLRKGRGSLKPSVTGRNIRHGSEARERQTPRSGRVSCEMTQKEKRAIKTRFLRRSQETKEMMLVSDSNQKLMIGSKPNSSRDQKQGLLSWKNHNPEGQGLEAGPLVFKKVATLKGNYLVLKVVQCGLHAESCK